MMPSGLELVITWGNNESLKLRNKKVILDYGRNKKSFELGSFSSLFAKN